MLSPSRALWPLAVAETLSWGLLYHTFGVLLGPMAAHVRATEAEVSGAFSFAMLAAGIAAPLVGRAVDHRGAGAVMMCGSVVGAAGFAALGPVTTLVQLYAVWGCLGVAHACTSYEPAFAAATKWFSEPSERRRALLVITSLAGFASTIFVPLAAWLLPAFGLESSALVFAALLGLFVTPLHLLVGWATPRSPHVLPARAHAAPDDARPGSLVMLGSVVAIHAFASMGAVAFCFPSLLARGLTASHAAVLAGAVGAAQVPARLLYGPLCRLVPSRIRFAALLLAQAAAMVGWAALDGAAWVLALIVFGGANGLATLERASVIAEWFGVQAYGARSGIIAAGSALGRAAAPLGVALAASHISYGHAFMGLAGGLLAAAALQARGERARRGAKS